MTLNAGQGQQVIALCTEIRPMLFGKDPIVVEAALADLLAIWVSTFPADARRAMLAIHLDRVYELVTVNENLLEAARAKRGQEITTPDEDWDV
jgi:hypothetical protein